MRFGDVSRAAKPQLWAGSIGDALTPKERPTPLALFEPLWNLEVLLCAKGLKCLLLRDEPSSL